MTNGWAHRQTDGLDYNEEYNSISLQCIPWAVGCSQSGSCLIHFNFEIWGKWPLRSENFPKCLWNFLDGTLIHVLWTNMVKIGSWEVAENSSGFGDKQKISGSKMGWSCPKLPERCRTWPVHVYRILSELAAVCRTYSWKIYFLDPNYQHKVWLSAYSSNNGFPPTVVMTAFGPQ